MDFKIKSGDITKAKTPCLILGVYDKHKLSPPVEAVDSASGGALSALLKRGDMTGRNASCLVAYDLPGITAERVLLLGLGKRKELNRTSFDKAFTAALARLSEISVTDALVALPEPPAGMDLYQLVRHALLLASHLGYRYEHTKEPAKDAPPVLKGL